MEEAYRFPTYKIWAATEARVLLAYQHKVDIKHQTTCDVGG